MSDSVEVTREEIVDVLCLMKFYDFVIYGIATAGMWTLVAIAFTEKPEADITAHRWTARMLHLTSLIPILLARLAYQQGWLARTGAMLGVGTLMWAAGNGIRFQALRWQVEDIHHADNGGC